MIGVDIISIEKIEEKSTLFLKKVFLEEELSYACKKTNKFQTLAGIFALKEAVIKAYDLSLSYIIRKRIQINYKDNKPYVIIDGNLKDSYVSISHDSGYAVAVCIANDKEKYDVDLEMKKLLPKRNKNSHKGDYGKVAILGGSSGMAGSCYLSSKASLRVGAGLVYLLVPKSISDILQIKSVEQIVKTIDSYNLKYNKNIFEQILNNLDDKNVLAIGPGMGNDPSLNKLIGKTINKFKGKIIIDADGLNALSKDISILHNKDNIILTPHLKEFSRLTGLSIDEINSNRNEIAIDFAKKHKIILVLKSEQTIVTDGYRIYVNKIGNPGMATAGSGDVLTGVIAGLLPLMNEYDAARLGVYLHSFAGDLACQDLSEESLIASDIIKYLPKTIKLMR